MRLDWVCDSRARQKDPSACVCVDHFSVGRFYRDGFDRFRVVHAQLANGRRFAQ